MTYTWISNFSVVLFFLWMYLILTYKCCKFFFFNNYRIILRWVLGDGVGISVFYYHQEENIATLKGNICWRIHFYSLLDQVIRLLGFPGGSDGEESTCNAGDLGLIPGLGRSSGGGHGNPLQNSCLKNSTDRGAWQATVHWVAKIWTWLSDLSRYSTLGY